MSRTVYVLCLVALAAFTSCSENFPESLSEKENASNKIPIYVYTLNSNIIRVQDTRGTGAFDKVEDTYKTYYEKKLTSSIFNIYAFRYSPNVHDTDFSATMTTDKDNANCLVDDEQNYYQGKPAKLPDANAAALDMLKDATSKESDILYYSTNEDVAYDFFAYYVDDLPQNSSTVHRTATGITIDVELDGSQDLLYGMAPRLTYNALSSYQGLTTEEKTTIANAGAYSTYAAHRGVQPTIALSHALTRLRFRAFPADETAKDITIKKVGIESKYKGTLTVATSTIARLGFLADDDVTTLYLHDFYDDSKSSQLMQPVKVPDYDENLGSTWNQNSVRLGESILLPSSYSFPVTVEYDEVIDGVTVPCVAHYTAKLPETMTSRQFNPEYVYDIDIAVYGTQQVAPLLKITPWRDAYNLQLQQPDDNYIQN